MEWRRMYPASLVRHMARISFDHHPLLLQMQGGEFGGPKPFRFERIWWEYNKHGNVMPAFKLSQKLIGLKEELRR